MKNYKEQIIKLRREGFKYQEIVDELGCSLGTVSYYCRKKKHENVNTSRFSSEQINRFYEYYKEHTAKETAKHFGVSVGTIKYYCPPKEEKKILTEKQRKQRRVESVQKRREKVKQMAVEYKGGKCKCCGYNKYIGALEFHHIDPTKKTFGISCNGLTKAWGEVKKELDKCILVCSNCHREIHAGIIDLNSYI